MEFDSPADFNLPTTIGTVTDLDLDALDAILEVDVVNTVPPDVNLVR